MSLIQAQLQSNTFGHGVFNNETNAAVSGGTNSDKTPIGVPSTYAFTVNDNGIFFQTTDSAGHVWTYGPHDYAAASLRAQAAILIHEYGHQLTIGAGNADPKLVFQPDSGPGKAEKQNNKLVDKNCRKFIEGLQ